MFGSFLVSPQGISMCVVSLRFSILFLLCLFMFLIIYFCLFSFMCCFRVASFCFFSVSSHLLYVNCRLYVVSVLFVVCFFSFYCCCCIASFLFMFL